MSKLNRSAFMGFICCFLMIIVGISTNGGIGTIGNFLHLPSAIITFGGTLFAGMITSDSFKDYVEGLKSFSNAFERQDDNLDEISTTIFDLSKLARQEGLLALEERADHLTNEFLQKGIRLMVDGTDPDLLKDILDTEMLHEEEEAKKRIHFWEDLGAYAPAWGMIGTLLGLINMMKTMSTDSSSIGSGMSLALVTTLYGSIMANWICIPIARKLTKNSDQSLLIKELIAEGVLSIQAGDNPQIVKEKIRTYRADWEEKKEAA